MVVAEIAQLVERRPEKPCVPSSILGLGTILKEVQLFVPLFYVIVLKPQYYKKFMPM